MISTIIPKVLVAIMILVMMVVMMTGFGAKLKKGLTKSVNPFYFAGAGDGN